MRPHPFASLQLSMSFQAVRHEALTLVFVLLADQHRGGDAVWVMLCCVVARAALYLPIMPSCAVYLSMEQRAVLEGGT